MARTRIDDLAVVVSADTSGLANDLRDAHRHFRAFQNSVDRLGAKSDFSGARAAAKEAAEAKKAAREMAAAHKDAADKSGLSWKTVTASVIVAGAAMSGLKAAGIGVATVMDQIKDSVRMAADMEQTTLAFDVMLGSAKEAKEMVSGLRKFAADTPFGSRETTAAGKQLLAYGVAADQIVPTLRMLGDVSAGFGKDLPIGDLTYLYGTLFAQQRAYAVDVKQFAGRGIPIYEELAKVLGKSVAEVKELTEEGRIGRDEITAAFKSMTSEGGKFYQMTKRQSETLAGSWEQTKDAFDLFKMSLGKVIIEETGLKQVVKDLELFANRAEAGVGGDGIRRTIRFMGDLAKAGAQVSYEFARASVSFASTGFESIGRAFPGVERAANSISQMIRDAQNFKIDKRKLTEAALEFSEMMVVGTALFIDWAEGAGDAIKRDILDPLKDVLATMKAIGSVWDRQRAADFLVEGIAKPMPAAAVPLPAKDTDVLAMYRQARDARFAATDRVEHATVLGDGQKLQDARAAEIARHNEFENFLGRFHGDRANQILMFEKGFVPLRKEMQAIAPKADKPKSRADIALEGFNAAKRDILGRLDADEAKAAREAALAVTKELRGAAGFAAMGQMHPLLPAMELAGSGTLKKDVRLQGDMSAGASDLKKQLRELYDPLNPNGELMRRKRDLDELLSRGEISKDWHTRAWRESVGGVADRMGIGGQTQLPDSNLMRDSEAATRAINAAQTGNKTATTEDLLRQILNVLGGMGRNVDDAVRTIQMPDVSVPAPWW